MRRSFTSVWYKDMKLKRRPLWFWLLYYLSSLLSYSHFSFLDYIPCFDQSIRMIGTIRNVIYIYFVDQNPKRRHILSKSTLNSWPDPVVTKTLNTGQQTRVSKPGAGPTTNCSLAFIIHKDGNSRAITSKNLMNNKLKCHTITQDSQGDWREYLLAKALVWVIAVYCHKYVSILIHARDHHKCCLWYPPYFLQFSPFRTLFYHSHRNSTLITSHNSYHYTQQSFNRYHNHLSCGSIHRHNFSIIHLAMMLPRGVEAKYARTAALENYKKSRSRREVEKNQRETEKIDGKVRLFSS